MHIYKVTSEDFESAAVELTLSEAFCHLKVVASINHFLQVEADDRWGE